MNSSTITNHKHPHHTVLLALQYVPMSRLRIEGLLAAFRKLIATEQCSRSSAAIYQPLDNVHLFLITNMHSNILSDLSTESTLRMMPKLVPEYCGDHDEDTVSANAFNLLYALDEVMTPMGYKEAISYVQIENFMKMDSAEEKLSQIIENSKLKNAKEVMAIKAAEFDKKRRAKRKSAKAAVPASAVPSVRCATQWALR